MSLGEAPALFRLKRRPAARRGKTERPLLSELESRLTCRHPLSLMHLHRPYLISFLLFSSAATARSSARAAAQPIVLSSRSAFALHPQCTQNSTNRKTTFQNVHTISAGDNVIHLRGRWNVIRPSKGPCRDGWVGFRNGVKPTSRKVGFYSYLHQKARSAQDKRSDAQRIVWMSNRKQQSYIKTDQPAVAVAIRSPRKVLLS